MQQDKSNIENKLRQLENQQLPDLSQMDDHWQQMQQMLSPAANATNNTKFLKLNKKILFLAASLAGIIFLIWLSKNIIADKGKNAESTNAAAVIKPAPQNQKDKSFISDTLPKLTAHSTNKKTTSVPLIRTPIYADVSYDKPAIANPGEGSDPAAIVSDNSVKAVDTKKIVEEFYNEIQKPVQEFTVNAEKGGSIICTEGTRLIVPASAFVDEDDNGISGQVKITVLEYYKYSEMIAANLTTVSDGKQLVTGGMVRITAEHSGRPVKLRSNKALDLTMPAKVYDEAMRLFVSTSETNKMPADFRSDIITGESSSSARYRNINWIQSGMQSSVPVFDGKTTFLDMADAPFTTRYGNKIVGKFEIPRNSDLTPEEAKEILTEKYGYYYDKIKVKRSRRKQAYYDTELNNEQVGDSIRLTLSQAIRWQYIDKKDSAFYAEKIKKDSVNFVKRYFARMILGDSMIVKRRLFGGPIFTFKERKAGLTDQDSLNKYYDIYIKTQQTYSFSIQNLGWINCDRFSNYNNKTDFVINLPGGVNADHFVSQLVFTSIRSVLPGRMYENKIGFLNVPVNMPVYLVGLGEKDGKVVSFMEKLKTGKKEISVTNFEETTAETFKKKLAELDLQ
jgi:hypothetical protein